MMPFTPLQSKLGEEGQQQQFESSGPCVMRFLFIIKIWPPIQCLSRQCILKGITIQLLLPYGLNMSVCMIG